MNAHTRAEALRLLDEMDKQDALEDASARTAYYEASDKLRALLSASDDVPDSLRLVAKRNLRSLIERGSDDKATMLSCLEELS